HQQRAGRDGSGWRANASHPLGERDREAGRPRGPQHRGRVERGVVMRFDVVTLFPQMFAAVAESGITSRALQAGLWQLKTSNPRDCPPENAGRVDAGRLGGGPGGVMRAEPLAKALEAARAAGAGRVIYLSPQGRKLDHRRVVELAKEAALT